MQMCRTIIPHEQNRRLTLKRKFIPITYRMEYNYGASIFSKKLMSCLIYPFTQTPLEDRLTVFCEQILLFVSIVPVKHALHHQTNPSAHFLLCSSLVFAGIQVEFWKLIPRGPTPPCLERHTTLHSMLQSPPYPHVNYMSLACERAFN